MASLNPHLAREMQTVFPGEYTAFCLCRGGINPLRCSLGSQTLQQFMSERLHRLQLLHGFSQTTLALQWLLISFFPLAVRFGLWPRKHHLGWFSPEKPPLPAQPHSICGMTSYRG